MAKRKRSRKHAVKRSRTHRKVAVVQLNPRRRKHLKRKVSRRRYRRNPGFGGILPTTGFLMDSVYVTGGFIGTKLAANMVMPMIGVQMPIARIAVKGVLAGVLGFAGKALLGKQAGQFLMLGGLVETVNDAVQTYVTPFVPALAVSSYPELSYNGYDLSNYPGLSAYPDLSGIQDDDVSEQV